MTILLISVKCQNLTWNHDGLLVYLLPPTSTTVWQCVQPTEKGTLNSKTALSKSESAFVKI